MQFKLRSALDHFIPVDTKKKKVVHSVNTMRRQSPLITQKRLEYKEKQRLKFERMKSGEESQVS